MPRYIQLREYCIGGKESLIDYQELYRIILRKALWWVARILSQEREMRMMSDDSRLCLKCLISFCIYLIWDDEFLSGFDVIAPEVIGLAYFTHGDPFVLLSYTAQCITFLDGVVSRLFSRCRLAGATTLAVSLPPLIVSFCPICRLLLLSPLSLFICCTVTPYLDTILARLFLVLRCGSLILAWYFLCLIGMGFCQSLESPRHRDGL